MYLITIISKNKISFDNFIVFFNNIINSVNINLNIIKKYYKKKHRKKIFTILKSPHVNKTAQEQFEFNFFSKQFLLKPTTKNLKIILLLKKTKSTIFSDIKIIIKLVSNPKLKKKNYKIFNLNNFKIKNQKIKNKKIKKVLNIFNIFDIYGELTL